jgi:RNA polymerase sigma-70 factor (ECF subfamily)
MGVLHMAIPFPASSTPLGRAPGRAHHPTSASTAHKLPVTLATSPRSPEARVHRTPEQQAEQDALAQLVTHCLAGEQRAWHQLVTCQHRRVYAICFRFIGDASEAEDITQEVFLKVYRHLASFDAAKGSFQTWITTLTRNLLVDNYRRTRMERVTESLDAPCAADENSPSRADRLADTQPTQEQRYSGLELRATIQAALAKLSPELREAVILRDLEDMDYKEIALIMNIPEGTVKSRISRGRGELARLLQRREGQVM